MALSKGVLCLLLIGLVAMMWLERDARTPSVPAVRKPKSLSSSSAASSALSLAAHPSAERFVFSVSESDRIRPDYDALARQYPAPWQSNTTAYCTLDQVREGAWAAVRGRAVYREEVTHLRCYPSDDYKSKDFLSYEWKPNDRKTCAWRGTFAPVDFCRLLRHSAILIAGDSLSWEHYRSLMSLMGHHIHQSWQHQSLEFDTNIVLQTCKRPEEDYQVRVVYRRDDQLQKLHEALHQEPFPTVVVLNRGAHYTNDTHLLEDLRAKVVPPLRAWKERCRELHVECQAIWRTTVPGTPHCGNFTKPVTDRAAMEAYIEDRSNYDDHTLRYHWYNYQNQNQLVTAFWESDETRDLNVHILDAYASNVLRPDEHRAHQGDCLHNCYPGKMDIYNIWMLHILKQTHTMGTLLRQSHLAARIGTTSVPESVYDREGWEAARANRAKYGCPSPPCEGGDKL